MTVDASALDELYQEVILDHFKRPRHTGAMAECDVCQEGKNPLCGDELTVYLKEHKGSIAASFKGHGCSISQASASIMMDAIQGLSEPECRQLIQRFETLMREGNVQSENEDELSDIDALSGVRKFPVRIKCAALAWKAFELGLNELNKKKG